MFVPFQPVVTLLGDHIPNLVPPSPQSAVPSVKPKISDHHSLGHFFMAIAMKIQDSSYLDLDGLLDVIPQFLCVFFFPSEYQPHLVRPL